MEFEWDPDKAASNIHKHGVGFSEAASVFGDPLAMTYFDPAHSEVEDRFLTFVHSNAGRLLVVSHTDRRDRTRSSVPASPLAGSENNMKNDREHEDEDLLPEYDLSQLKGGVRGKYLDRYRSGTNLALLEPEVRAAFPTDAAVNEALRSVMQRQSA